MSSTEITQKYQGLIDGGYLSFVFGSRPGYGGWWQVKHDFRDYLIVMDSRESVRAKEFVAYKSRRKDRRRSDARSQEIYEQVNHFRSLLREDTIVATTDYPGYEADDLVALLFICHGPLRVIGVDKDFMMVPGIYNEMSSYDGEKPSGLKLPKYAFYPDTPAKFALTQGIFGDKSDSIPRLLPSIGAHSKALYNEIFWPHVENDELLAINLYSYFGDQLITNLRLVLLPHPTLAINSEQYLADPEKLLLDVASGRYWEKENWSDELLTEIKLREEAYNDTSWEDW